MKIKNRLIFLLALIACASLLLFTGCFNGDDTTEYKLTIEVEGEGTVTPSVGTHTYDEDTIVDLTAEPTGDYEFSEWVGDVADNTSGSTTVLMDANKTVKAVFTTDADELDIIEVDSNISSNTTWTSDAVYVITSNISVSAILTIEPGTIIKFDEDRYMDVSGGLIAEGTEDNPIIFTSLKDDEHGGDTNQDGDLTSPSPGDWENIRVWDSAKLEHCKFYYGGAGGGRGDSTLLIDGSATVKNSTFAYNTGDSNGAMDIRSDATGATIQNNIFYSNNKPIRLNASVSLDNSNIFHNPEEPEERNVFEGIFIDGSGVTRNVTWEEREVAFVIQSANLTIGSDYKLTIKEGVTVKSDERYIQIYGNLEAIGTEDKPIVFTSFKDDEYGGDSNGDGNFSTPAPGDWENIRIWDTAVLEYCKFYYGGSGGGRGDSTVLIDGSVNIKNSTFAYNTGDSNGVLDVRSDATGATITDNIFYNNNKPIRLNASVSLDNSNTFHNPEDPGERNVFEGIFIDGSNVTMDVTWEETEIAFVVRSRLTIGPDYRLILGDNVTLKFDGTRLVHNNNIDNYDGEGVVFTSYKDDEHGGDSNGDGDFSSPAVGDWEGVRNDPAREWEAWENINYAENP